MRRSVTLALALLASGCARNALLELEVQLPPGIDHAELRVLSDPPPSYDDPEWDAVTPEALDEVGEVARVQVLAEGPAIEAPLAARVRLCGATPCDSTAEVRVEIERPFYVGHETRVTVAIPAVPLAFDTYVVDRCAVRGCLGGDTLEFCRDDGTHYCE